MRLPRRIARASFRTLAVGLLFLVAGVAVLLRTGLGHQVILDWALQQVDGRVAGTVEVASIRSGGILRGGRLLDVGLHTPDGDLLLAADSLEVSYDLRGLLGGNLAFTGIRAWGLRMELIWEPGKEGSTLSRWVGGEGDDEPEGEPDGEGGSRITLSDIRVVDGHLRLRRPTGLAGDGLVRVLDQDGGTLALDVLLSRSEIPSLRVAPDRDGGTVIQVETLQGEVLILQEPIPVRDFAGRITVAEGRIVSEVEALDLPHARAAGEVTVHLDREGGRIVEMELDVGDIRGTALDAFVPWLPPFTGTTRLTGTVLEGSSLWRFRELDGRWSGGTVTGSGGLRIRDGFILEDMDLRVQSLPLEAVSPYLPAADGKPGTLSGNVRLDGPVDRLGLLGRVTLRTDSAVASTADVSAVLVQAPGEIRVADGEVLVSPLDYRSLDAWVPGLPVGGRGDARFSVAGGLRDGLRFDGEVIQRSDAGDESHILARGGIRQLPEGWSLDVQGDAAPFHLSALRDRNPDLPLQGAASGSFRVNGRLDDLRVRLEVEDVDGRMEVDGRFDPLDLTGPVEFQGSMEGFSLGRFVTPLQDRTEITGEFQGRAEGRGDAMTGSALVRVSRSRVRGVPVDSLRLASTVRDGRLVVDTLRGRTGGFEVDGGGTLALSSGSGATFPRPGAGSLDLTFSSDSLMGLRPLFLGEQVHARDTLNDLDREVLLLSGVDPDTLPLVSEVTLTGRVEGRVSLRGALDRFDATGDFSLEDVGYGDSWLRGARVEFTGRDLPGEGAVLEARVDTDSLHVLDRDLAETRLRGVLTRSGARISADLLRREGERYTLAGGVDRDGEAWRANLDQLSLQFDSLEYGLTAPASFTWSDSVLVVRDLELVRPGEDPVSISADGILPLRGPADFSARIQGLHLERVTRLLQLEGIALAGHVDLELDVGGSAASPEIQARVATRNLVLGEMEADDARVTLDYRNQEARLDFRASREGRLLAEGGGTIPMDIPLWGAMPRTLDRPMDLRVAIQEVEVAPILGLLEDLEEVEGMLSGDFTVTGTPVNPEPVGMIRLEGGAWTVGALGVRQENVSGTFALTADGTVATNVTATAGGRVDLSGEVRLEPLRDPGLDLTLRFQRFQAVDRRDVAGSISGQVQVTGSYTKPLVEGSLQVDEGTLFLEEFQRAVGVVDLSDPLFLGLVERESFVVPVDRPLLAGTRNPFLDSLRVDVALAVPRNTWLRSDDMNVEMGGELEMVYDRPRRDFVLIGELLARRGQYVVLGRTFEVEGGSVEFIGIPGINPILDIQASSRIRRRSGEVLDISATVSGSLADPSVELSTEEQGLAQSDLVSYLIFGRPSAELTARAAGSTSTGNQFLETGVEPVVSVGVGTLASQLGALAAQQTSFIDYLSVTQVGDLGIAGGDISTVSSTQVEVGWYLGGGDIFGALVLRPLSGVGSASTQPIGGARLEWQPSSLYRLEAFLEDRILRQGAFGLTDLGLASEFSFGFSFFREWGY